MLPGLDQIIPSKYTNDETKGYVQFTVETTSCLTEGELANIATIWFDQLAPINTTWAYKPIIYSEPLCGPIDDECLDFELPTDHSEVPAADLTVYPNPVNDVFTIEYLLRNELDGPLSLSVLNSQGQVMVNFQDELTQYVGVNQLEVNAANWVKGIYFVKLDGIPEVQTWKFLKL